MFFHCTPPKHLWNLETKQVTMQVHLYTTVYLIKRSACVKGRPKQCCPRYYKDRDYESTHVCELQTDSDWRGCFSFDHNKQCTGIARCSEQGRVRSRTVPDWWLRGWTMWWWLHSSMGNAVLEPTTWRKKSKQISCWKCIQILGGKKHIQQHVNFWGNLYWVASVLGV